MRLQPGVSATLLVLLGAAVAPLEAQRIPAPRADPANQDGRFLQLGAWAGLDYENETPVLGVHVRLPVDPWKRLAAMPGAQVNRIGGVTEWQINGDLLVYPEGSRSLYVGGGWAFRNTLFVDEEGEVLDERETRTGYSFFVGLQQTIEAGSIGTQIEFRWVRVENFGPNILSFGLNYPVRVGS